MEAVCSAHPLGQDLQYSANEASHSAPGALVAAPHQPNFWPMGSSNSQQQPRMTAEATPSGFQLTLPGLSSLLLQNRVQRPLQQHTWLLPQSMPQSDGAGDQSSEDVSSLDRNGVMNLLATAGLGDEAESQQQAAGKDEVEEIQAHVPYEAFLFLAKMRALVVINRRHQHGAVADSLAKDSCRKRMLERAVLARFARGKPSFCPLPCLPPCNPALVPLCQDHVPQYWHQTYAMDPVWLCLYVLSWTFAGKASAPTYFSHRSIDMMTSVTAY